MKLHSKPLPILRSAPGAAALALGVAALLLAGCGDTKDKPAEKAAAPQMPASPTIASLGGADIKAYELANEMRVAGVPMGKDKEKPDDQITKRLMRELVQRKYIVQKAIAEKIDRDPNFLVEAQRQREQLLATMYLQRAVADASVPGSRIEAYQANHPLMFAKRQAIEIEQIIFPLNQVSKQIPELAKDAKTLDQAAQLLKSHNIAFSRGDNAIGSGDMPPETFDMMQKKAADNVFFTARGGSGVFFVVKEIKPQPLTGEPAAQLAKRLLLNEVAREKATEKPPEDLKVRYEGDLERIMNLPDAPPQAPKPAESSTAAATPPASAQPAEGKTTAPADAAVNKPAAEAAKGKPAPKR